MKLEGAFTALITPFLPDESVDYDSFRKHVRHQVEKGIRGLVVLGTTGEAPTIEADERAKLVAIALEESKGKSVVVVGAGTNNTKASIAEAKEVEEIGAQVLLISPPAYNKPTQQGIYLHYEAIAKAVKIPILVYNIKGRTAVNIETSTLMRIAKLPNVIGVKEASGDISQMQDVINNAPEVFYVLSGDDAMTLQLMKIGGKGVVSVISNLVAERVVALTSSALAGDYATAEKIDEELKPLVKAAFIETNPIPIKTAMNLCGWHVGHFRLPMCEMLPENKKKLEATLREMRLMK